jgi:hypothetical protein
MTPHWEIRIWISLSLILIDIDAGWRGGVIAGGESGGRRTKKCGADHGDPNLRIQPRLPGSVVGEASMREEGKVDKITEVTVPR